MKTRLINLFIGTGIFLLFAAPSIEFDVMIPAWIQLPGNIKSMAIIDRSVRDTKLINVIEGGITGENIGQDNIASKVCLEGIYDQLSNTGMYKVKRTGIRMKGNDNPMDFAHPLPWKEVERICTEKEVDALLSLEFFDTDYVGDQMKSKIGIRIYDPGTRTIADQYSYDHQVYVNRRNPDFIALVNSYIDQDAIKSLSYEAGILYGQRIAPYWIRMSRTYYNKPKRFDNLAYGSRMMEVNNWDEAISSLEKATMSKKRKVCGRAAHNLAVVYEILGDFEQAKKWAQEAWGKYKNKDSKEYLYALNERIRQVKKLDNQLDN